MPQFLSQITRRRVSICRAPGECLQADAFQFAGNRIVELTWRSRVNAADQFDYLSVVAARKGRLPVNSSYSTTPEVVEHTLR